MERQRAIVGNVGRLRKQHHAAEGHLGWPACRVMAWRVRGRTLRTFGGKGAGTPRKEEEEQEEVVEVVEEEEKVVVAAAEWESKESLRPSCGIVTVELRREIARAAPWIMRRSWMLLRATPR